MHKDCYGFERGRLPAAPTRAKTPPALAAEVSRLEPCGVGMEERVSAQGLKPNFQARHGGAAGSRALSKQLHE
jgi:hypothetical protein